MSAIPYDTSDEAWDSYDDADEAGLPPRRRRQWLTRASAVLFAAVVGAACFYAGVRVEKGQVSSSTGGLSALTSGSTGAGASRAGATGASGRSGAASLFGGRAGAGFPGGAFGGGGATFGTVSSVHGNTLYITKTATGDVVKVTLSSATSVTKSVGVGKSAIRPGDTVTATGAKNSNGSISATSISDSGNRSGASGASSSGSSTSSTGSSSSAVGSLFGGG